MNIVESKFHFTETFDQGQVMHPSAAHREDTSGWTLHERIVNHLSAPILQLRIENISRNTNYNPMAPW